MLCLDVMFGCYVWPYNTNQNLDNAKCTHADTNNEGIKNNKPDCNVKDHVTDTRHVVAEDLEECESSLAHSATTVRASLSSHSLFRALYPPDTGRWL